jgi:hypothetical protein
VAKLALIEREKKRAKLVAKYADKRANLKAIIDDQEKSEEERYLARLELQKLRATRTRPASVTAARSPVVPAAPSASSAWRVTRSVKSPSRAKFRV